MNPKRLGRKAKRAGENSGETVGCGHECGSLEREGKPLPGILGLSRGRGERCQVEPLLGSGRTRHSKGVGKVLRKQGMFLSHETVSGGVCASPGMETAEQPLRAASPMLGHP